MCKNTGIVSGLLSAMFAFKRSLFLFDEAQSLGLLSGICGVFLFTFGGPSSPLESARIARRLNTTLFCFGCRSLQTATILTAFRFIFFHGSFIAEELVSFLLFK